MRIEACFDSHVHWQATGEFSERLQLKDLKSPNDVLTLSPLPQHFRGDWLLGFGWDQHPWSEKPHRKILDQWYPSKPVALQRCDAHALWLNSEAMKRTGFLQPDFKDVSGGRVERDSNGEPTGIVVDKACDLVQAQIPKPAAVEVRRFLLKAIQVFNEAGITHIRDMTCDESQWAEAVRIDQAGLLTLAVEEFFWLKNLDQLDRALALYKKAKQEQTPNLRAKGIKVFYDGALGSEGALLSRCYHGRDHSGLKLWSMEDLTEVLVKSWEIGAEVAVHTIGDAAVADVVELACKLRDQGRQGMLHLEHGELIQIETIQKMRDLKVAVHMQPSHWLSDEQWLKEKIGDLLKSAFPWRRLQEAEIPFDFGSDSPIETANLARTFAGLESSSEAGIPRLLGSPTRYMGHQDLSWAPNSYTILGDDYEPMQVVFRGEHLI